MYRTLVIIISVTATSYYLQAGEWREIISNRIRQVREGSAQKDFLDVPIDQHNKTPLDMAIQLEPSLVIDLLQAGADPNKNSPLQSATSYQTIKTLLNYKADIKKCRNGCPMHTIFTRYCNKKKNKKTNDVSYDAALFKDLQNTMLLLFSAGADPNQQWYKEHPLETIIKNEILQQIEKIQLASLFIYNGCSLETPIKAWDRESLINNYKKNHMEWGVFLKEMVIEKEYKARHKIRYERARQFLMAYKEKGHPVSTLPRELIGIIGDLIMYDEPEKTVVT